jgi:hypothetical protein
MLFQLACKILVHLHFSGRMIKSGFHGAPHYRSEGVLELLGVQNP